MRQIGPSSHNPPRTGTDFKPPETLALPPRGKGKRTFQCFDCDRPDPLTTEKTMGWLMGELRPPKDPRS